MASESQFIRGAGMLAVLKVLERGELYGYAIVEALAKTKGDALHLGQATVYPMLYNLEAKGLVKARWDESGPRPRKYYSLTKAGKTRLADDADEWSAITRAMASLGLERAAWLRASVLALVMFATFTAFVVLVPSASAAPRQSAQAPAEGAADAYERLNGRFTELYDLAPDESREAFMFMGYADESMQRWLDQARPLGRELIAASRRPYVRNLDYSQGFDLLLPHYAGQRQLAKTARLLAHDAAQRGDAALAVDFLGAQIMIARQAGGERVVIGSLISQGVVRLSVTALDEILGYGLIDRAAAETLVKSRDGLAASLRAQLASAIEMEASIVVQEVDKLVALDESERNARLALLGINQPIGSDAASVDKWKTQAESYNEAMKAAVANPDPKEMRAAIEALSARVAAGEFGDFLKLFNADLGQALLRMDVVEAELARQDALLGDIVRGKTKPEDLLNAARYYEAAAMAVEALSVDQQRTIEVLRVDPGGLADADRREARRAIESLRARVIDNVMRASTISRCVFDQEPRNQTDLLPAGSEGILGALRVMLYDPLLAETRPEGAPSAVDACVAGAVAIRHLAQEAGLGRALIAQRFSRDLARALADLDARGLLDAAARERIAKEIGQLKPDDPFGLRRAIRTERIRISYSAGRRYAPDSDRSPFSRARLANFSPDSIAFLTAALSFARPALKPELCNCPYDGPLLEVRPLFDTKAFAAAMTQESKLRERMWEAALANAPDGGTALEGLTVTKPVDMQVRFNESVDDFQHLQDLLANKPVK